MRCMFVLSSVFVHRRIGGLEKLKALLFFATHVHRRIGGLEMFDQKKANLE